MMNKEITRSETQKASERPSESAVAQRSSERVQTIIPPYDILESGDEYLIRADVPGVRAEQLEIQLRDEELTVRARASALGSGLDLLFGGRAAFEYGIRFRVPAGIDGDKVNAEISNGVLAVHLPKAESRKPRQIPVRAPS